MATVNGAGEFRSPVIVSLQDLRSGNIPFHTLVSAFGPDSLGILLVRDLPPQFPSLRSQVLSNSSHLAHLPPSKLQVLINERAKYLVGWSHGKETLRPGVVDRGKGSYYLNCRFYQDRGRENEARSTIDEGDVDSWHGFDEYTAPNLWPDEETIPGFRAGAEALITLIIDVAVLVARACDRYAVEAVQDYPEHYLERVVRTSSTTKARLLHYFPARRSDHDDDWCATHLDHGCLTGLTSAMFVDESITMPSSDPPKSLDELPEPPDPLSGLYIRSRNGDTIRVDIPRDCLAFQTGQALELITKGRFKAVPHFVRGVPANHVGGRIARNTLAVFTQPNLGELVDHENGINFGDFARGVVSKNTA